MQRLLTTAQVAELTSLSVSTLRKMRMNGTGPRFVKLNRRVAYRLEDVEEFIAASLRGVSSKGNAVRISPT